MAREPWIGKHTPLLLLAAMVLVFFSPFLFLGRTLLLRDLCFAFHPGQLVYRESLLQGVLPLWTPYTGCGEPLLMNIEMAVFYPPNLVFVLLPLAQATAITYALHMLLAGAGTYWTCRLWRVSRPGALLAGVSYAFSNYVVLHMEFTAAFHTVAWYPVALAAFVWWLRRRTLRRFVLLAGVLSLEMLAGWVEAWGFTVGSLALYALFVGAFEARSRRRWSHLVRPLAVVMGAAAVAVAVAMVEVLPFLEGVAHSTRVGGVDPGVDQGSINPLMAITLLLPSIYGIPGPPGTGRYWAPSCLEYSMGAFHVGVVAVVVLVMAMIHRVARGRARTAPTKPTESMPPLAVPFLLTLLVLAFLYAMGKHTPFFGTVWRLVPLLQVLEVPSKARVCVVLAVSCLAGIGLDYLAGSADAAARVSAGRRCVLRWATGVLFFLLSLFLLGCLLDNGRLGVLVLRRFFNLGAVRPEFAHRIPWRALVRDGVKLGIVSLASAALLYLFVFHRKTRTMAGWSIVLVAFADLAITGTSLLPSGQSSTLDGPPRYLNEVRPSGKMVRYWTDDIYLKFLYGERSARLYRLGRDTLARLWPQADKAFMVRPQGSLAVADADSVVGLVIHPEVAAEKKERLLRMLNCEIVLQRPDMREYARDGRLGEPRIIRLKDALPRAYVVGGLSVFESSEDVLRALASRDFDPLAVALTDEQSAPPGLTAGLQPGRVPHTVTRLQYGPNRLDIDVASETAGVLVVSDTFYPGWRARVNGTRVPIIKVNGAFRGIPVPAGTATVAMNFAPLSLDIGMIVSLCTLTVVAIIFAAHRGHRRHRRSDRRA